MAFGAPVSQKPWRRAQSTINGVTTAFVGDHYESATSGSTTTITKYYYAGAQRVAVRNGSTLTYMLGDHLGSTSAVVSSAGSLVMDTRYKPWGEVRYATSGQTLPTRYTYTGQYSYMNDEATDAGSAGFGLMFYNARWYDPYLNHFTQPDSIVPDQYNPQDWDRYAYSRNSPLQYTDPDGHFPIIPILILVGAFFILNGTSDSIQTNVSPAEVESRKESVIFGASVITSALSLKSPIVEALANTYDCATGYCDPNLMIPGSAAGYSEAAEELADVASTTTLAKYDPQFAAQQLLDNGEISVDSLNVMIPNDVPNTFIPSSTIPEGCKYCFDINGTEIELKWHAPDSNAYNLYGPSSYAGTRWTVQVRIDKLLLGGDGRFYLKQQGNLTHIPLYIPK